MTRHPCSRRPVRPLMSGRISSIGYVVCDLDASDADEDGMAVVTYILTDPSGTHPQYFSYLVICLFI